MEIHFPFHFIFSSVHFRFPPFKPFKCNFLPSSASVSFSVSAADEGKKATWRKVLYKEMLTARNYFVGRLLLSWQSHLKLISRCRQYIHRVFCAAVVVVVFGIIGNGNASQVSKPAHTEKKTKGKNASQIKLYHHYTQREALWSLYFFLSCL